MQSAIGSAISAVRRTLYTKINVIILILYLSKYEVLITLGWRLVKNIIAAFKSRTSAQRKRVKRAPSVNVK